jgi:hypothetical protein
MITMGALLAAPLAHAEDAPEKPEIELVESGPIRMKDKRGYKNLVVLGPRLLPPGLGGRYMRSLDDHLTLMVGGGYSGWRILGVTLEHADVRAGLDLEPLGNGLHGFYVGPRVVYKSFYGDVSSDGDSLGSLRTETLGIGGVAGYRIVVDPGASIGFGVGASYNQWVGGADASLVEREDADAEIVGTVPIVELTLGWAF